MSLRSGLGHEIAYAITTLTMLSIMSGGKPGSGFPLHMCEDLLDVIADLLEDQAFGEEEEDEEEQDAEETSRRDPGIWTRPQLIALATAEGEKLVKKPQRVLSAGPREDPSAVILAALNLLRNFALIEDNYSIIPKTPRLLNIALRLCDVVKDDDGTLRPASDAYGLSDLLRIHNDVSMIFFCLAGHIRLSALDRRSTRRIFCLCMSYIVDPSDAVSPYTSVNSTNPSRGMPPPNTDLALEVFSRLSQPDDNRKQFSESVSPASVHALFEALLHMFPLIEADFSTTVVSQDLLSPWMGYLSHLAMSLYSLVFFAPVEVKREMRKQPGVSTLLIRVVRFYLRGIRSQDNQVFANPHYEQNHYAAMCRRILEALSLLDQAEDSFDPVLAEPLAFGPPVDLAGAAAGKGKDERGLLSAEFPEVFLTLMCSHGIDDVVFSELESLVRVGDGQSLAMLKATAITADTPLTEMTSTPTFVMA